MQHNKNKIVSLVIKLNVPFDKQMNKAQYFHHYRGIGINILLRLSNNNIQHKPLFYVPHRLCFIRYTIIQITA